MIAYKGFNKDMTCLGFQFEEGKTYEEDAAKLCKKGFHACEMPLDVFNHYNPASSVFHRVELEGIAPEREGDSKVCAKKITIGPRLSFTEIARLQAEYVKNHAKTENTAGDRGVSTAGDWGVSTAGNRGVSTAGYWGVSTAGDGGVSTAGDRGISTSGDGGVSTAGNRGVSVSRGSATSGENGISVVRGTRVKAKGGSGAVLVIVKENEQDGSIVTWKAGVIDGNALKPDTWYELVDGEFVEA